MAVSANRPLKNQGNKLEAISAGKFEGSAGLVAAHLKRKVRGTNTMDGDQDGASSQRLEGRQQMRQEGKPRGSN